MAIKYYLLAYLKFDMQTRKLILACCCQP